MTLLLPVQGVVDRTMLLEQNLVDTPVRDPQSGGVIQILKNPVGGPYGPMPGDPPGFVPVAGARMRGPSIYV